MSAEPQLFRINPENRESEKIAEVEFARLGLRERRDIQEWIAANPRILGEELLIIGKEFSGFDKTNERLDLLAVDEDGKLVVIELKRDDTGLDAHWQAIRYASYFHRADEEDIIDMLAKHEKVSEADAEDLLLQHLGTDDLNSLNNDQRIILASHRFAPEVTSAALWLNEKAWGEDFMTCVQLIPYHDGKSDSLYIQANTIIPMPGVEEYAVGVGDTISEDSGSRSILGVKMKRTIDRKRNDEVTRFLRKVGDLTIDGLTDEIRPDMKSKWGVGQPNHRFYLLWYSRLPWRKRRMRYQINLFPDDGSADSLWRADVGFEYNKRFLKELNFSEEHFENLEKMLQDFEIHDERIFFTGGQQRTTKVEIGNSYPLDDNFAKRISITLRPFIEAFTPAIDEFEDERSNQEDA